MAYSPGWAILTSSNRCWKFLCPNILDRYEEVLTPRGKTIALCLLYKIHDQITRKNIPLLQKKATGEPMAVCLHIL